MSQLIYVKRGVLTRHHKRILAKYKVNVIEIENPDMSEYIAYTRKQDLINELSAKVVSIYREITVLKQALSDIYEIYASMDGFIPETAPEACQQQIINDMAEIAGKHK